MPHAYLHLRRVAQWQSYCRKFRVELDGRRLDAIRRGADCVYPIEPGPHELMVSIDWVSSEKVAFECRPGEHVRFVCRHPEPTMRIALNPADLVSAIELIRDEGPPSTL